MPGMEPANFEVHDLLLGRDEALDTLRALRAGAIDAVVIQSAGDSRCSPSVRPASRTAY